LTIATTGIIQNHNYKQPIFTGRDVSKKSVADLIKKDWTQPAVDLLDSTSKLMASHCRGFYQGAKSNGITPITPELLMGGQRNKEQN
jgi:hypothetical protein